MHGKYKLCKTLYYLRIDCSGLVKVSGYECRRVGESLMKMFRQSESVTLPIVPHCQPVLDVISEVISLWCVRSMGLLADSFAGLFSTLMMAID